MGKFNKVERTHLPIGRSDFIHHTFGKRITSNRARRLFYDGSTAMFKLIIPRLTDGNPLQ